MHYLDPEGKNRDDLESPHIMCQGCGAASCLPKIQAKLKNHAFQRWNLSRTLQLNGRRCASGESINVHWVNLAHVIDPTGWGFGLMMMGWSLGPLSELVVAKCISCWLLSQLWMLDTSRHARKPLQRRSSSLCPPSQMSNLQSGKRPC